MSTRRRPAVLAVLATAMLLTSGIAGVAFAGSPSTTDAQQTDTPDGDEVVDSFVERISTLETVRFTQTIESTYNNETTTRTVRIAADLEDFQKRSESVGADSSSVYSNTTTVTNESKSVTYNADENTVTDYEVSGTTLLPRIEALSNESRLDYGYRGTDTVEGRDTHVLEVTPEEQPQLDGDVETSATLYVDRETHFPVRMVSETVTEDSEFETTTTYRNVTIDEEIPDSTFELDVPEDATDPTENIGPEITSYESYGGLAANTTLSVPGVEIGDGFDFEHGTTVDGDHHERVSLTYSDGDRTISVSTRPESAYDFDYEEADGYESVEIGDTTGYRYSSEDFTALHWETDQSYSLYGETDNGTTLDIAESITGE